MGDAATIFETVPTTLTVAAAVPMRLDAHQHAGYGRQHRFAQLSPISESPVAIMMMIAPADETDMDCMQAPLFGMRVLATPKGNCEPSVQTMADLIGEMPAVNIVQLPAVETGAVCMHSQAAPTGLFGLPADASLADDGASIDMHVTLEHAVPGTKSASAIRSLQVGKKDETVNVDSMHDFVKMYTGSNGQSVVVARRGAYCPNGVCTVFSEIEHNRLGGGLAWAPRKPRVLEFGDTKLECFTASSGLCYLKVQPVPRDLAQLAVRRMMAGDLRMGMVEVDANGAVIVVAASEEISSIYSSLTGSFSKRSCPVELVAQEIELAMNVHGAAMPLW